MQFMDQRSSSTNMYYYLLITIDSYYHYFSTVSIAQMLKDFKADQTQQATGYPYPKCEMAVQLRAVYYRVIHRVVS